MENFIFFALLCVPLVGGVLMLGAEIFAAKSSRP